MDQHCVLAKGNFQDGQGKMRLGTVVILWEREIIGVTKLLNTRVERIKGEPGRRFPSFRSCILRMFSSGWHSLSRILVRGVLWWWTLVSLGWVLSFTERFLILLISFNSFILLAKYFRLQDKSIALFILTLYTTNLYFVFWSKLIYNFLFNSSNLYVND